MQIRSLAPSQNGKRPLLGDINSDFIGMRPINVEPRIKQKENKRRRTEKDVQISDRKLVALTSTEVSAALDVISDHVSCFLGFITHTHLI